MSAAHEGWPLTPTLRARVAARGVAPDSVGCDDAACWCYEGARRLPMTAERTPDARVEAAVEAFRVAAWSVGWEEAMTAALAAADAVQREGLTERVAEVLRGHRWSDQQLGCDPQGGCEWDAIGTASDPCVMWDMHDRHIAAAVVAAIYGARP